MICGKRPTDRHYPTCNQPGTVSTGCACAAEVVAELAEREASEDGE